MTPVPNNPVPNNLLFVAKSQKQKCTKVKSALE